MAILSFFTVSIGGIVSWFVKKTQKITLFIDVNLEENHILGDRHCLGYFDGIRYKVCPFFHSFNHMET
jgi:hypothetical protein